MSQQIEGEHSQEGTTCKLCRHRKRVFFLFRLFAHGGPAFLVTKFGNTAPNPVEAKNAEKSDHERGDRRKRELTPEPTAKCTIVQVRPDVKPNQHKRARFEPAIEPSLDGNLTNHAHQVHELNAPTPHHRLSHVDRKLSLDQHDRLL